MPLPKKIPQSRPTTASTVPDEKKRVIVNRYRVEKKLGSGNFGTAYLVTDLKTKNSEDEEKVLKQIPCGDLAPDETVDAMHEAKLLSKLNNTGIVKFHDSFVDGEFFCIVTEFCEGGDLDDYVSRMKKRGQMITEKQIMDWTVQLLLAVHYMHCRRVLHRDLKARNIFLRKNFIKIGDFGISRILMGTADMATTFTGTPYYMSPEVLKHEGYNSKSDVWSIGCIIFELCCQRHAFEGQGLMGVMYKIVEGDCPQIPEKYSKNLQELLKKIFTKDPDKRPSASEVLKIPFVARHLEKMKGGSSTDQEMSAEQDAQALEMTLQKKVHMKDLQVPSEDDKLKHLTPRERMRIRKQQEADKKAQELSEAAAENLHGNMTRKMHIQELKGTQDPAPWTGVRRERTFAPVDDSTYVPNQSYRPKTAPAANQFFSKISLAIDDGVNMPAQSAAKNENPNLGVVIEEPSDDEENTLVEAHPNHSLNRTAPVYSGSTLLSGNKVLNRSVNLDDRPITPMKDRMVYDREHSSLDFRDGVPEDPNVANTFYSQYDDFEEDKDSSGEIVEPNVEIIHQTAPNQRGDYVNLMGRESEDYDEDENEGTLIGAVGAAPDGTVRGGGTVRAGGTVRGGGTVRAGGTVRGGDGLKVANTLRGGTVVASSMTIGGGTVAGEEAAMIRQMEDHLNTLDQPDQDEDEDYNEDTITLADDTVAGAFGPTARSIKIGNLRRNGEGKLGKVPFRKAYEFLKKMRYGDDNSATVDESHIMAQLRQITPNISDCFIIDQLLFLEKQADIDKNS